VAAGPLEETITGVALSRAFDLPLTAGVTDGRWWAHGVGAPGPGSGSRHGA
jgi:iron complex transport system ATP-binding protein